MRKRREKVEYIAADSIIMAAREVYWAPCFFPIALLILARQSRSLMTMRMVTRMLSASDIV
jgi:hypothetical protein